MATYEILIADDHPLFAARCTRRSHGLGRMYPGGSGQHRGTGTRLTARPMGSGAAGPEYAGAYGFSGLVLLRGQYPQIPVVMVSAQEEADIVVRSREFGASGFIPKSSSMEQIQTAVRTVLDGDVSWPPQAFEEINVSAEAKAAQEGLASLTPQQFRVLTMVCEGLLNKQIAYELSVSEATIKAHVTAISASWVCAPGPAALLLQQLSKFPIVGWLDSRFFDQACSSFLPLFAQLPTY